MLLRRMGFCIAAVLASCCAGAQVTVDAPGLRAVFARGALSQLTAGGRALAAGGVTQGVTGIVRTSSGHAVADEAIATVSAGKPATVAYRSLQSLPGASIRTSYAVENGEILVRQEAASPQDGLVGVQWGITGIPYSYNVVVPGNGGIRIRKGSPGASWRFDYPISWESQFVIVEGQGHGFRVWAEDAKGRYKRLSIQRSPQGWRIMFVTENNAPWAPLKACSSVRWRIGAYRGDWRVPAKQYRDWMAKAWPLTPLKQQTPAWAAGIRFVVTMPHDIPTLEALAKRCDASKTMLYIPNWRAAGYDRMYPNYDADKGFPEFVARSHALGFKVMVHCNYFGVDPKSPEYAEFERFQVRNPTSHALEWWTWDAEPPIKFAYINPASSAWRKLLVSRLRELVQRYKIDAMHLDQTLCIYNDDNGLVDGMTMIEGNLALHREVREALPQVAISGEGLDEITMRYEAFAQRHSHGLDFVNGTWDRPTLAMAHPICSYLFHAHTQPYGYLGMTSPANGQVYSAWRENYKRWAVLPTVCWPSVKQLSDPSGFLRLALDEAAAFATNGLEPDPDGPWPTGTCFPYRGAKGVRAAYREGPTGTVFTLDTPKASREVTRVITGVSEVAVPGSLDGWRCYDDQRLMGLDPDVWYAYSTTPRSLSAPHVTNMPSGATLGRMQITALGAVVETRVRAAEIGRVASLMADGRSGSAPLAAKETSVVGPLYDSPDGAFFMPNGANLHAHPPWKTGAGGSAFTEFSVAVPDGPGSVRFLADVAMEGMAIGPERSDGVLFTARILGPSALAAQVFNDTSQPKPMEIDLTGLKGRTVRMRLEVGPGPKNNVSFDWARWYRPRIEVSQASTLRIGIAGAPAAAVVLSSAPNPSPERNPDGITVSTEAPGAVYLLREQPAPVSLPLDLAALPPAISFAGASGGEVADDLYASYVAGGGAVGSVQRTGISAHPPDNGRTIAEYAMTLPDKPVRLVAWIGLRDGSTSDGCDFIVQANGREIARVRKTPGAWSRISADLGPWAGKPVVLAVITDSAGSFNCDWAVWADPRIE